MTKIDYRSAGVNIDAGNESVSRIKRIVQRTFSPAVLTGLGSFGSMYDLGSELNQFQNPVLVQSMDGVGTKMIIARRADRYDTIGADLVSACVNDILTLGARPLTFLDYIANDRLVPTIIEQIVEGIAEACKDIGISLVGGETAEMPDTYLPGEQDLVGTVTGFVEREKIITGQSIKPGDWVLGLPSSGLHTNGYSLARKILFKDNNYAIDGQVPGLKISLGDALLAPHVNYTKPILSLLDNNIEIKGIAHITGGGLAENIPRILPKNCSVEINIDRWPVPPIFNVLQSLGKVEEAEMYRVFNMGIGIVIIVDKEIESVIRSLLSGMTEIFNIGRVHNGNQTVTLI
ncbi:MAG: phosphoribosylformylglycinamidine cyclo-ligase [Fidelibacterota bacterium]